MSGLTQTGTTIGSPVCNVNHSRADSVYLIFGPRLIASECVRASNPPFEA
ncbi:hypothetical protein [Mesotoga sp. Brook.08.105.5.1]|nr:hypothetical protein [Mesotoga sp. Brook.08.105.5.1]